MRAVYAVLATFLLGCANSTTGVQAPKVDDAHAAAEAEAAMHKLHHAWDAMDMAAVEDAIVDDGFLTTFEYTESGEAVRLASKKELVAWLTQQFGAIKAAGSTTAAVPQRRMECKASGDIAYCSEECDILISRPDGKVALSPHRATSVLRKGPDGWKFVHWHTSETAPSRVVEANSPEVVGKLSARTH
jgi:ketosteroid isomerase-like protein